MGRHVERAENIARMVDVNLQLLLDVPTPRAGELEKNWLPVVAALGDEEAFAASQRAPECDSVTEFLVFDRRNPNSIVSCLCAARENARTVREQISTDMWELLNRSFHWITGKSARQTFERSAYDFFERVKETSHLFQGITNSTLPHGEGWEFIQVGIHLERADKTSRFLDDDFHLLRRGKPTASDLLLQWTAVLRSCSAREAYQRIYVAEVEPKKVAQLLLLDETFPRSVLACVNQLNHSLRAISGVAPGRFCNVAEKICGRLAAELAFSTIDDLYSQGLHKAMDDLQAKLNQIGIAIFATYINQPLPPEPEEAATELAAQQ
jgi:uncharacterized alpha-E superfamily protein